MRYECLPCPVCNSLFGEKDDVVVCPICGTPHHRECWKSVGHCANKDKHEQGFLWVSPLQNLPNKIDELPQKSKMMSEKKANIPFGVGELLDKTQYDQEDLVKMSGFRPIDGAEKIGELKVSDYGEYVDRNKQKYIPKFYTMNRTERKVSWNWAAFFFSVPWLFYRKMAGLGIVLGILAFIIPLVFAADMVNFYNEFSEILVNVSPNASSEELAAVMPRLPLSFTISRYMIFAVMLFCGMFGNHLYMKKATHDITKLKSKNLDADEYEFVLRKKGSVSALMAILSIVLIYAALELALQVSFRTGTDISTYIDRIIAFFQK